MGYVICAGERVQVASCLQVPSCRHGRSRAALADRPFGRACARDNSFCDEFVSLIKPVGKSKRYASHFECDAHDTGAFLLLRIPLTPERPPAGVSDM